MTPAATAELPRSRHPLYSPLVELLPLTCAEVVARLDDYLDRELSAEEMHRVAQHLDACAACIEHARLDRELLDSLKAKLRHLETPDLLLKRIRRLVEDETDQ